jgi:hypothetical protein
MSSTRANFFLEVKGIENKIRTQLVVLELNECNKLKKKEKKQ